MIIRLTFTNVDILEYKRETTRRRNNNGNKKYANSFTFVYNDSKYIIVQAQEMT